MNWKRKKELKSLFLLQCSQVNQQIPSNIGFSSVLRMIPRQNMTLPDRMTLLTIIYLLRIGLTRKNQTLSHFEMRKENKKIRNFIFSTKTC